VDTHGEGHCTSVCRLDALTVRSDKQLNVGIFTGVSDVIHRRGGRFNQCTTAGARVGVVARLVVVAHVVARVAAHVVARMKS